MTAKDFWSNSKVAVVGAGAWGTVLSNLVARNAREVRLWTHHPEQASQINSTRLNSKYVPGLVLKQNISAHSDFERLFDGAIDAVIWALPSKACREQLRNSARFFRGHEVIIHATKGLEEGTSKRISEMIREELPCSRIGVLSGPNLALEVARGDPSATVVASAFDEVIEAGQSLLPSEQFRVYSSYDVTGVEWAGSLKNIFAIASGAMDSLHLGWNAKAILITRGLVEMARFGTAMGAKESTFLGLAGLGDLLATSSSSLSRNYRTGLKIAAGEPLEQILKELGGVAEGVRTTGIVRRVAMLQNIPMPITDGVYQLLEGKVSVQDVIHQLMTRPLRFEG